MNVEVSINNNVIVTVTVREDEANRIAERLYDEYKIGILQMVGIAAGVYITGVKSSMGALTRQRIL